MKLLGADTDKLRSDELRAVQAHMKRLADAFTAEIDSFMPLAETQRSKVDEEITRNVDVHNERAKAVVRLLTDVAGGSIDALDTARRLFSDTETANTANAGTVQILTSNPKVP